MLFLCHLTVIFLKRSNVIYTDSGWSEVKKVEYSPLLCAGAARVQIRSCSERSYDSDACLNVCHHKSNNLLFTQTLRWALWYNHPCQLLVDPSPYDGSASVPYTPQLETAHILWWARLLLLLACSCCLIRWPPDAFRAVGDFRLTRWAFTDSATNLTANALVNEIISRHLGRCYMELCVLFTCWSHNDGDFSAKGVQ